MSCLESYMINDNNDEKQYISHTMPYKIVTHAPFSFCYCQPPSSPSAFLIQACVSSQPVCLPLFLSPHQLSKESMPWLCGSAVQPSSQGTRKDGGGSMEDDGKSPR